VEIKSFAELKLYFDLLTAEQQVRVLIQYTRIPKQELLGMSHQARFRLLALKLSDEIRFDQIRKKIAAIYETEKTLYRQES
jgi:hypothetical protein